MAGLSVENLIAEERGRAHAYGDRTIFGTVKIAGLDFCAVLTTLKKLVTERYRTIEVGCRGYEQAIIGGRLLSDPLSSTERFSPSAVKRPERKKIMPIILWLLGVPLVVIVLLYVLHVV